MIIIVVRFPDERRIQKVPHLHHAFPRDRGDQAIRWVHDLQDRFGPLQWTYNSVRSNTWKCSDCPELISLDL